MDVLLPLTEGSSHPMVALGRSMAPVLHGDMDGARRGLMPSWPRARTRGLRGGPDHASAGVAEMNEGRVDLAAELAAASRGVQEVRRGW